MSDVFGAMVERSAEPLGNPTTDTWKHGEDVVIPLGTGYLRSLSNPTVDGLSKDYWPDRWILSVGESPSESNDYGYVHRNSGIGNLAFYLLSQGGTHPRGVTTVNVSGQGYAKAQTIFYLASRDYFISSDNYRRARTRTAQAARGQYGTQGPEHTAVCRTWDAVGVPVDYMQCHTGTTTKTAPVNIDYLGNCYSQHMLGWTAVTGATSYELWSSTSSSNFDSAIKVWSGALTTATISSTGTKYVRAKACDALGCSLLSTDVQSVTSTGSCTW